MRKWIVTFAACLVLSISIPIGFAVWYTTDYARHACNALEVLTATPVKAPADPAQNPSRVQVYKLYLGLKYWEAADGCRP